MDINTLVRKKVYDPILRLLHLVIGLNVLGLLATSGYAYFQEPGPEKSALWILHIKFGYILISAFSGRLVWFFIGPQSAKIIEFLHFTEWKKIITERQLPKISEKFGHDPVASLAYLIFYGMIILISLTGLFMAAIDHGMGPLTTLYFDELNLLDFLQTPHLFLSFGIAAFIGLHIGAIIHHEKSDQRPISQAMISGYQYRKYKIPLEEENEKKS